MNNIDKYLPYNFNRPIKNQVLNDIENKENVPPLNKKVTNLKNGIRQGLCAKTQQKKANVKQLKKGKKETELAGISILKRKKEDNTLFVANTRRKVTSFEENGAASTGEIVNLQDGIQEHAHLRLQLFYAEALYLYGVAKRTNKPSTDVDVWVEGATKQHGKGDRRNHAAHANLAAGRRDNLKEHYIQQIVEEGLTPVKLEVLTRIRHLSSPEKEQLQENYSDEAIVRSIIEKIWPGNSVTSETELDEQLNATDKLPYNLNLGCDLTLEKALRPLYSVLMKQVLMGDLTPRDATDVFVEAIQDHFAAKLKAIKQHLKELKNADVLDIEAIKRAEDQQFFTQNEMNGTNTLDYDAFECKKKLEF